MNDIIEKMGDQFDTVIALLKEAQDLANQVIDERDRLRVRVAELEKELAGKERP